MMLYAIALENTYGAVVHAHRTRDGDCPLGKKQPVALIVGDADIVGDRVELRARHVENRAGVDRHKLAPD